MSKEKLICLQDILVALIHTLYISLRKDIGLNPQSLFCLFFGKRVFYRKILFKAYHICIYAGGITICRRYHIIKDFITYFLVRQASIGSDREQTFWANRFLSELAHTEKKTFMIELRLLDEQKWLFSSFFNYKRIEKPRVKHNKAKMTQKMIITKGNDQT